MEGIIASGLMGRIRCKDEISGPKKTNFMHASRRRRQTLPSKRGRRIRHRSSKNGVGMKEDKSRW